MQNSDDRRLDHGWEVPLRCTHCGAEGLPEFRGWSPNAAVRLGDRGTIYAKLFCPQCDHALTTEAEQKLAELFSGVSTPPANRRAIWLFVGYYVVLALVLALGELLWPERRRRPPR